MALLKQEISNRIDVLAYQQGVVKFVLVAANLSQSSFLGQVLGALEFDLKDLPPLSESDGDDDA